MIHHDEITAVDTATTELIRHYEEHLGRLYEEIERLKAAITMLRDLHSTSTPIGSHVVEYPSQEAAE